MRFFFRLIVMIAAAAAAQGCAGSTPGALSDAGSGAELSSGTSSLLVPVADKSVVTTTGASGYPFSREELDYNCKKLTGIMQIRILTIRDEQQRDRSSLLSRALNAALGDLHGSKAGADPEGRYVKDIAMLKAYNAQLASKGCKTYDLNAELVPKDFHETPTATIGGTEKTKK